jgi:hypothetical protein
LKPAAFTWAAFGARGTGKTAWCKQQIERLIRSGHNRVMVWDAKKDADLKTVGEGFDSWPAFVAACKRPAFVARYRVSPLHSPHEQFDAFCKLAWREGNVVLFVDELAEVTKANKAPGAWRTVVNVGRSYDDGKKSISIIAASQRPTEVDKSFLGNADLVHTGRLGFADDCKTLAGMWGIKPAEIANLPDLAWLEKRASAPEVLRGVLTFRGDDQAQVKKKRAR